MTAFPAAIQRISYHIAHSFGSNTTRAQQAILLFYLTTSVLVICFGFIVYFTYQQLTFGVITCLVGVGLTIVEFFILLVLRRVGAAGHFFCLAVLTFFMVSIYFTSGLRSPYIPWMVIAPVTAALLFGNRQALIWTVLMLGCYLLIALATWNDLLADPAMYLTVRDEISLIAGAGFFCYTLIVIILAERARMDRLRLERLVRSDQQRQATGLLQVMEGRELERQRISRELHDGLNTQLTALRLQYQVLLREMASEPAEGRAIMEEMNALATGVSELSERLSIHVLRDFGLEQGIRHLARQFQSRRDIRVEVLVDREAGIPPGLQIAIYRMLQEALETLTGRLAATEIELQVLRLPDMIRLMVEGTGQIIPGKDEKDNLERTMREIQDYMHLLRGETRLEPDPAGGFSLIIEIPGEHEKDQTHTGG